MTLTTGDIAPNFNLLDEQGNTFELHKALEERLLLVFYPGDNTPVCTAQLCDYRDGIEEFQDLGIRVIGISKDSINSHQTFKERHKLPFTLLSDPNLSVANAYGCKSLIGMKRGVFVLDSAAKIIYQHVERVAVFRREREEIIAALSQTGH